MCHYVHLCGVCDLDMRHMCPDYVAYAVGICGLCISGGPKHISGWYVLFYVHCVRNVLGMRFGYVCYAVQVCGLCGSLSAQGVVEVVMTLTFWLERPQTLKPFN